MMSSESLAEGARGSERVFPTFGDSWSAAACCVNHLCCSGGEGEWVG